MSSILRYCSDYRSNEGLCNKFIEVELRETKIEGEVNEVIMLIC